MWTICQANGCIWKVESYVDGTQKIIFVKQFGKNWLFSQSLPSFHQSDYNLAHIFDFQHILFSFMKSWHEVAAHKIFPSLFIFLCFINLISTKTWPKGLERDRTLRVPVFLTLQTITQTHTEHLWYMQILNIFPSHSGYFCEACLWHFWWCPNYQKTKPNETWHRGSGSFILFLSLTLLNPCLSLMATVRAVYWPSHL